MLYKVIITMVVLLIFSGCTPTHVFGFRNATAKLYKGEELPDENISIIKGDISFIFRGIVYIEGVDSQDFFEPYYVVNVLPGRHRVKILHVDSMQSCFLYSCTREYFRCNVYFYTEAGKEYKIYSPAISNQYNIFIKVSQTGEIIHKDKCRIQIGSVTKVN